MKSHLALACLWIVLGAFAGCGKAPDAHLPASAPGSHIHVAPHGGTLVPLGEHAYNLELVRDADTGRLSLYVLDGHAENFIRITAPTIELVAIAATIIKNTKAVPYCTRSVYSFCGIFELTT